MRLRYQDKSIVLRNPELGNTQEPRLNIVANYAMDGTIRAYASPVNEKQLHMTFSKVDRDKAEELRNFFAQIKTNDEIFLDFQTERWRGRLLNDTLEIIHAAKTGCSFILDFVGEQYG